MSDPMARHRFRIGHTVGTPGAIAALGEAGVEPATYLDRHLAGDWGDMDDDDKKLNDEAIDEGSRIFSAYLLPTNVRIWVITEADRSSTCILLPGEY